MSERRDPEIDIGATRDEAKRRWIAQHEVQRGGVLRRIEQSVPWWLVIITIVMLMLSAPHTAAIFDKLTPGWGWSAPFGVEFGILYASFRRKRTKQQGGKESLSLIALQVLLYLIAIVVNGAGAFQAVVSAIGIPDLPFSEISARFGTFPATSQIALSLVIFAALIIPIGTGVTGEGVATLLFERDVEMDERWRKVEYSELRKAFFEAYLRAGVRPLEAKRQSVITASGFIEQEAPPLALPANVPPSRTEGTEPDKPRTKKVQAKEIFRSNPQYSDLSVRELEARTGIDKNTWSEVKRELSQNGNHHHS